MQMDLWLISLVSEFVSAFGDPLLQAIASLITDSGIGQFVITTVGSEIISSAVSSTLQLDPLPTSPTNYSTTFASGDGSGTVIAPPDGTSLDQAPQLIIATAPDLTISAGQNGAILIGYADGFNYLLGGSGDDTLIGGGRATTISMREIGAMTACQAAVVMTRWRVWATGWTPSREVPALTSCL